MGCSQLMGSILWEKIDVCVAFESMVLYANQNVGIFRIIFASHFQSDVLSRWAFSKLTV